MYSDFCKRLQNGLEKISVIGLGYVGLPLAMAFADKVRVLGYDLNRSKIGMYRSGCDPTHGIGNEAVRTAAVEFTDDATRLREARFHIIAVPTPVHDDCNHTPDLRPLVSAARILGSNLTRGSVVVLESTVYPGVTEEVCVPILEETSGLTCGVDFKVGYSPERINPGDRIHVLENVVKVVAGLDGEALDVISQVYGMVVKAGVYRVSSVKVAEASKLIENTQRDANIALVNELAVICDLFGIDTEEVLAAARTKWNFHDYVPGLVGGHCIGVDPYYLRYAAEQLGYCSQVITAARRVNDSMGKYIAETAVKHILKAGKELQGARVAVLGFTFKENCPDIRNTRVYDIVQELRAYGIEPLVTDPLADPADVQREYGVELCALPDIQCADAVVLAVAHDAYKKLSMAEVDALYGNGRKVLMDVKGLLDKEACESADYIYWRL
ncbi:MAG: nucleotide sugar dehydrogenase [Clostridia bacterium]|nr:nucleotide sugar dehydrogenase [Clostridia bacterium]